jgi:uroporphyrinogen decarboxylase
MTGSRDLVDMALNGTRPERIPVSIVSTAWVYNHYGNSLREVDRDADKMADAWLAFDRDFDCDTVCPMFSPMIIPEYYGSELKFPEGGFPIVVKPAIEKPSDLDKLQDFDARRDKRVQASLDCVKRLVGKLGEKKFIWLVCIGPISNVSRLMNTELIMESLIETPGFVHEVFQASTAIWKTALEPFLDAGIDAVDFSDPIASPNLVSPRMYRTYFQKYDTEVAKWVQRKGVHAVYHVCGNVIKILSDMNETGAHGLSIDAPVDLREARQMLPHATFVGNIDPANIIMNGSEDMVEQASIEAMKAGGSSGPMVLAPGCDVPPTSPAGNIHAMIRAAKSSAKSD